MPDLARLLSPRSIAVLGGGWARKVIEECDRLGYEGEVWPVHPGKAEIAGKRAYASVADLPGAPDAAFVGVNRHATLEVVRDLAARGAGGAVLFASGFSETGDGALTEALLDAAGGMPVLGPNCYGFVNALDGAVIWPDQQGCARVEKGVAILSQSSNIAITLTMQRRGLPVAFVVCLGNAAQVGLAGLAEALLADDRVTALGLYVEGIGDACAFADVVARARRAGKGVVALKAGRSEAGRNAAATHTASLAGEATVSSAFFRQAGVGEVSALPELVETLKILHAYGPIRADRLVSVSCSGGEAGLMADTGEAAGVTFAPIPDAEASRLAGVLGPLVTISNPLDYQTFIWGDGAKMSEVFTAAVAAGDAGMFVLDLPRADRCSTASYDQVFEALAAARTATGKPVFTVATLHESIDEAVAERSGAVGAVALQGVAESFAAIKAASVPGPREGWRPLPARAVTGTFLSEADAKALLRAAGVAVPKGVSADRLDGLTADGLTPPFVLKGMGFAHKSEAGAVRLGLTTLDSLEEMPGATGYLLEEFAGGAVAELLIAARRDPVCGVAITVGLGGTAAELLADTATLVAPVTRDDVLAAFRDLRLWPLLDGYRGRAKADVAAAADAVMSLQAMITADEGLSEIEVNPLIVMETGAIAADALIRKETR
ncbi:MAG: acetate--CoA ligase family protein [Silicimonas sp.]|nr:acetate--CoA ligase family protein [Silicimonas sp.]